MQIMNLSPETFWFNNVDQAQRHFNVRKQIAMAMNQMDGNGINFFFVADDVVLDSIFELVPGSERRRYFQVKADCYLDPAMAVKTLEMAETRSDCMIGAHVAIAIGYRRALGDTGFNDLFGNGERFKVDLSLARYMDQTTGPLSDPNTVIPGDYRYMRNHPSYPAGGKNGAQGENCICVAPDVYSGLGAGYKNQSESGLRATLVAAYFRATGTKLTNAEQTEVKFVKTDRVRTLP